MNKPLKPLPPLSTSKWAAESVNKLIADAIPATPKQRVLQACKEAGLIK